MRTIHLVGVLPDAGDWRRNSCQLARIFLDARGWPVVRPANVFSWKQWRLAREVQRRINTRLTNFPEASFVYNVGTRQNPGARKPSKLGDADLLDAIRGDTQLWISTKTKDVIAGYYILPSFSSVVDE